MRNHVLRWSGSIVFSATLLTLAFSPPALHAADRIVLGEDFTNPG